MPNIAGVLREEIRRLAKKEIKAQVGSTKQAVANKEKAGTLFSRGPGEGPRVTRRDS